MSTDRAADESGCPRETLCVCATAVLRLQSREVARKIDEVCVEARPNRARCQADNPLTLPSEIVEPLLPCVCASL